jgi:hypothetical protein
VQENKEIAKKTKENNFFVKKKCYAPATIDLGSKTRVVVVERVLHSPLGQPKTKQKLETK